MIFLHLFGAIAGIGGIHYVVTVLAPAARRMGEPAGSEMLSTVMRRFRPIVWTSIALLVLSGTHLLFARGHLKSPNAPILFLKIALAFVVFGITLALTLPLKAFEAMQKRRLYWQRINLLVAAVVIFLAAYLLSMRQVSQV